MPSSPLNRAAATGRCFARTCSRSSAATPSPATMLPSASAPDSRAVNSPRSGRAAMNGNWLSAAPDCSATCLLRGGKVEVTAPRTITIIGGGLAGLTLGIGLRQRGIPATIFEASHYPRHRVCGEFISGNGPAVLERLDLLPLLERAGVIRVHSAQFISGANHSPVRQLSAPALGLSRYLLDATLADEFQRLGGELHSSSRRQENDFGEATIRASGRRAQSTENGWRWFGLKAHARNVNLSADLEMHISANDYIGVN